MTNLKLYLENLYVQGFIRRHQWMILGIEVVTTLGMLLVVATSPTSS